MRDINVPLEIVKKGDKAIREYIENEEALINAEIELRRVDGEIKIKMLTVSSFLGNLMPKEEDEYAHRWRGSRNSDNARCMRIGKHLIDESNNIPRDILVSREVLSEVLELVLERKALVNEVEKLKNKRIGR